MATGIIARFPSVAKRQHRTSARKFIRHRVFPFVVGADGAGAEGAAGRDFTAQTPRSLDPSEKGAVNYFLGMATCKLFAAKLLDAPWLLHLGVFRPLLNPQLNGRSRPDLLGETLSGRWLAFESKGRASPPAAAAKDKAKAQAQRIPVTYHIGGITYFKNDSLQFFWRDPQRGDPGGRGHRLERQG